VVLTIISLEVYNYRMLSANHDRKACGLKRRGKMKTQAALAAKEIRTKLKANFNWVKFRVISENYSMGDSVGVVWVNGPTRKEVEDLVGHYQYGHFNGMEDIYETSNEIKGLPQTKFLQLRREVA